MRFNEVGSHGDCVGVIPECRLELAEIGKRGAEIVVRFGVLRLQRDRAVVTFHRLRRTLQFTQRITAVVKSLGMVGTQRNGCVEALQCFGRSPQFRQRGTRVHVSVG